MSASFYKQCTLCPRECKADRTTSVGFCGMGDKIYAAKAMVHTAEEPCISGKRGSGAIFLSGCVLRCAFCQNHVISHEKFGKELSTLELSDVIMSLVDKDVHNINFVSPTQFYPSILESLDNIKHRLSIPVVWNTGGYEKLDAVSRVGEYADVFLHDMKFYDPDVSMKYAKASDYFYHAMNAACAMIEQKGAPTFDSDGMIMRGVIIRHLVIPSNRADSMRVLKEIKENIGTKNVILSLMSQYTPPPFKAAYKELGRRVTTFEYNSVCDYALELGFNGYFQQRDSAVSEYTPIFDLSGL